jgi:hypothetical protein
LPKEGECSPLFQRLEFAADVEAICGTQDDCEALLLRVASLQPKRSSSKILNLFDDEYGVRSQYQAVVVDAEKM